MIEVHWSVRCWPFCILLTWRQKQSESGCEIVSCDDDGKIIVNRCVVIHVRKYVAI